MRKLRNDLKSPIDQLACWISIKCSSPLCTWNIYQDRPYSRPLNLIKSKRTEIIQGRFIDYKGIKEEIHMKNTKILVIVYE
jgi:hypothetical protein